jgi:hypothetical protein
LGGDTQMRKFSVTFLLKLDEDNNILSSVDDAHEEDVFDYIKDLFYDSEAIKIENLNIKERQ